MRVTLVVLVLLILLVPLHDQVGLTWESSGTSRTFVTRNASYQPSTLFVNTWGLLNSYTRARAVAMDTAGNIYLAGSCCDSFPGEGNSKPFLVKLSSSGTLLWQRVWNSTLSSVSGFGSGVNAMALDSANNIYLAGYQINYTQYALVLKIDPNGRLLWGKIWNGNSDSVATGLAVGSTGDVFVSGIADVHNNYLNKILLLRFSADGSLVWEKTWEYLSDIANGITTDASGDVYLAGASLRYYGYNTHGLLVKFNSTGDLQWGRVWGGGFGFNAANNTGNAVTVDSDGSIVVTGRAQASNATRTVGVSFMKFNPAGNLINQRVWPKNGYGNALTTDSSGGTYIAGEFDEPVSNTFGRILILKLAPTGDLDWGFAGGSTVMGDAGTGVAEDPSGDFIVSGYISQAGPTGWVDVGSPVTSFDFSAAPIVGSVNDIYAGATNVSATLLANMGSLTAAGITDAYVIKASPPVPSPPDSPRALAVVVNVVNATLSWNAPLSNGGARILGYRLFKGLSNGSETLFRNLTLARSYTDTDLRVGVTYYYYVTAVNVAGESLASNRATVELSGFNIFSPYMITAGAGVIALAAIIITISFLRRNYRGRRV